MKARQSSKRPRECVAGNRQNSWSPKCRLIRCTRWPRAINARPSWSKKFEIGPCKNRNERFRPAAAWLPRSIPAAIVAVYVSIACGGLNRIEGRDAVAGAPALTAETHRLEQIDRFPVEDRLAQAERCDRPGVEAGPGQERVAPTEGPDLDPRGRRGARAPGVKAEGVGDDERVRRGRDLAGRRQPEFGERIRSDRAHQPRLRLAIAFVPTPA